MTVVRTESFDHTATINDSFIQIENIQLKSSTPLSFLALILDL